MKRCYYYLPISTVIYNLLILWLINYNYKLWIHWGRVATSIPLPLSWSLVFRLTLLTDNLLFNPLDLNDFLKKRCFFPCSSKLYIRMLTTKISKSLLCPGSLLHSMYLAIKQEQTKSNCTVARRYGWQVALQGELKSWEPGL